MVFIFLIENLSYNAYAILPLLRIIATLVLAISFVTGLILYSFINKKTLLIYAAIITNIIEIKSVTNLSFFTSGVKVFIIISALIVIVDISLTSVYFIYKIGKKAKSISMPIIAISCLDFLPFILIISSNNYFKIAYGVATVIKILVYIAIIAKFNIKLTDKNKKKAKLDMKILSEKNETDVEIFVSNNENSSNKSEA